MKKLLFLFLIILSTEAKFQDNNTRFNRIWPREADMYIGKWCEVTGTIFKVEINNDKSKKDQAFVVLHLSDNRRNDIDFPILTKVRRRDTSSFSDLLKKGLDGCEAKGKVILYKGRPALNIIPDSLKFLVKHPLY